MEPKYTPSKKKVQEQSKLFNSNKKLRNIKSDYFIQKLFDYLHKGKSLKEIKYNKSIQEIMNININDYKNYYEQIEIEIKPIENKYGKFINIKEDKEYYHIYYNDNYEEEIKSTDLNDKVSKINIIIDNQVKSFFKLFSECYCIESIHFKRFYRNNITNMSWMFSLCSSLKELNLNHFNTDNVTDMIGMFNGCSSLKELNLNNFNTNNVTDMSDMFRGCSSLKKLNLNNINTKNVTKMEGMFGGCESLKELDLSSFNTSKVTNMNCMFQGCKLLKELNIKNFKMNNVTEMIAMFYGCPDELKFKIKRKFKNIKEEAFKGF